MPAILICLLWCITFAYPPAYLSDLHRLLLICKVSLFSVLHTLKLLFTIRCICGSWVHSKALVVVVWGRGNAVMAVVIILLALVPTWIFFSITTGALACPRGETERMHLQGEDCWCKFTLLSPANKEFQNMLLSYICMGHYLYLWSLSSLNTWPKTNEFMNEWMNLGQLSEQVSTISKSSQITPCTSGSRISISTQA